ncbi:unnamed protein product [Agarophyton chilense]
MVGIGCEETVVRRLVGRGGSSRQLSGGRGEQEVGGVHLEGSGLTRDTLLKVLALYRELLRAVRFYLSKKRDSLALAIREDIWEKRNITGKELEKALWDGHMALERLQKWFPTSKQMSDGKDRGIKL